MTLAPEQPDDPFQCAVCQSRFTKPVLLPCGHTFCKQCMVSWTRAQDSESGGYRRTIVCPICRAPFPKGSELKPNYALLLAMGVVEANEAAAKATVPPPQMNQMNAVPPAAAAAAASGGGEAPKAGAARGATAAGGSPKEAST
jgi:hypothetical protein